MSSAGAATLGSLRVGEGSPVRVMAAVNVSPESFYKGSVARSARELTAHLKAAVEGAADIIDIGGMSTSPYLNGQISPEVETERVRWALKAAVDVAAGTPISVDTVRSQVAEMALSNGAVIVNDVTGLKNDPAMGGAIREHGASLIAMAYSSVDSGDRPVPRILRALRESLSKAGEAGVDAQRVALDPGIGFFRESGSGLGFSPQRGMPWYEWDLEVLANLSSLLSLGRPLCVGLSRKSFLGRVLRLEDPDERLPGSLAATALAVVNGAKLIRSHDVKETVQAVRVAEALASRGRRAPSP